MELTSIKEVIFNPVAQVKFVHTVAAGYVTAAMFVLGVSAWFMLKRRDLGFAVRSFAVAAGFGLASSLSVVALGDESGYTTGEVQRVKLAAIEAEWETRAPPAAFTVLGIPNDEKETTEYAIHVPWVLGLIATRSTDKEVTGIKDLRLEAEDRIRNGMVAYAMLERLRGGDKAPATMLTFAETKKDLGYALLLKRYTAKVTDATPEQIRQAAYDTIPKIAPLYWSFRVMVGLGMWFILVFVAAFWFVAKRNLGPQRWFFRVALYSIPLPWIASELGWIVAEYGRQPWTIAEMRPTFLSASTLQPGDVWFSLTGFIAFYTALLAVEMYLMLKYIRPGPSSLHSGRYHFEKSAAPLGLQPAVTQQAQAHAGGSEP